MTSEAVPVTPDETNDPTINAHAVYSVECECGYYVEFDTTGEPYDGAASDNAASIEKWHTTGVHYPATYVRWNPNAVAS